MKKIIFIFALIFLLNIELSHADTLLFKTNFTATDSKYIFYSNTCIQQVGNASYDGWITCTDSQFFILNATSPSIGYGNFTFPNNTNEMWYVIMEFAMPTVQAGGAQPIGMFLEDVDTDSTKWMFGHANDGISSQGGKMRTGSSPGCSAPDNITTFVNPNEKNVRKINMTYNVTSGRFIMYTENSPGSDILKLNGSLTTGCTKTPRTYSPTDTRTFGTGVVNISYIEVWNVTVTAATSNATPPETTFYDPIAVHLNGTEIISGFKTFLSNTVFSLATFTDITVSNIFGGNFFGNKIQANNLTVADTINSSKVNANAINASSISANVITTNNLTFTGSFASNLSQSVGLPIAVLSQTSPNSPIKKDFTSNGQTWIWWGKGAIKGTNAVRTVSLKLDNVEQDGVITKQASAADSVPFSLMFTKVIPSGLHSVNITTTGGTLQNLSLIGMGIR